MTKTIKTGTVAFLFSLVAAQAAMALLADDRLDSLITNEIAFRDLAQRLPGLLAPGASGLTAAICYETRP